MKAITVRQPWAALIAAGAKTIETRPRRTAYRGRVAIHAGLTPAPADQWPLAAMPADLARGLSVATSGVRRLPGDGCRLPLGAVVASAVVTDCVPIIDETCTLVDRQWPDGPFVYVDPGNFVQVHDGPDDSVPRYSEDEVHLGDFRRGRWALLLDDIKPTTERCPWCWGEPLPCGDPDHVEGCRAWCYVCGNKGRCDPIPARGQVVVPWEWTPPGEATP